MVVKVSILEDEKKAGQTLVEFFRKYGEENGVEFEVKLFETAEKFKKGYEPSDLAMIDIELPDGNGFEVSEELRRRDSFVMIMFVTNMAQYAVRGYEVEAFDFIVKPVSYSGFASKADRAMIKLRAAKKSENKQICLKTVSSAIVTFPASEIYYVEVIGHNLIYRTVKGDYEVYGSMKKTAKELEGLQFDFCNRCYLVNLAFVESVKGFECKVGGSVLQISHLKRKTFLERLNNYFAFGDKN